MPSYDGQLDPFRVDQQQPYLVRRGPGQQRHQDRVEARRLAGTGRAGDQDVRHLREVRDDVPALDVLAERDGQRVVVGAGHPRPQHVAEGDVLPVDVRHLDADRALARDRADDPHVRRLHRVGDVARQLGDPLDLDAVAELDLVAGDRRATGESGDRGVDVELVEHAGQRGDHVVVGLAACLRRLADAEHVRRRQLVVAVGQHELLVPQRQRRVLRRLAGPARTRQRDGLAGGDRIGVGGRLDRQRQRAAIEARRRRTRTGGAGHPTAGGRWRAARCRSRRSRRRRPRHSRPARDSRPDRAPCRAAGPTATGSC